MDKGYKDGREWGVRVPLGYSPTYSDETATEEREKDSLWRLRQIFGDFRTIRFRTMRFGKHLWEVTLEIGGIPGREDVDTQSVSGFSWNRSLFGSHDCDQIRLKDGQLMFIVGIQGDLVSLRFQTADPE